MKKMKWKRRICMVLCLVMTCMNLYVGELSQAYAQTSTETGKRETLNFNTDWLYSSMDYENGASVRLDDSGFDKVSVPMPIRSCSHTKAKISPMRLLLTVLFLGIAGILHCQKIIQGGILR